MKHVQMGSTIHKSDLWHILCAVRLTSKDELLASNLESYRILREVELVDSNSSCAQQRSIICLKKLNVSRDYNILYECIVGWMHE